MGTGLQKIENNEADAGTFKRKWKPMQNPLPMNCCKPPLPKNNLPKLTCPKCKSQQLIIRDKIVKCPDEACNWVQFRNVRCTNQYRRY
jgi:DNA topoisomerase-3